MKREKIFCNKLATNIRNGIVVILSSCLHYFTTINSQQTARMRIWLQNAIDINPNYAEAYNRRGLSKREIEDRKGAFEDYKKAEELGSKEAAELFKSYE